LRSVDNSIKDCQAMPVLFNTNPADPEFMKVSAPNGEKAQFNGPKDANGVPTAASSIVMQDGDGTTRVGFDTGGALSEATLPHAVTFRFAAESGPSGGVLVTATSDGAEDYSVHVGMAGGGAAGVSAGLASDPPTGGGAGTPSLSFARVNLKVCGRS